MCLDLAKECAQQVYSRSPPNEKYQQLTVELLLGTAATESHFHYRRQTVYSMRSDVGGWGLWQTEKASVEDNIYRLKLDLPLRSNCAKFLVGHDNIDGILDLPSTSLLRLIHSWDRLAILMCRLHYFKFKSPIPEGLHHQAEYYKIYYNTTDGSGSPEKYIEDWNQYVKGKIYG